LQYDQDIYAVAISPDNPSVFTGSSDGTVRLWTLAVDDLIEQACFAAGRNFYHSEWTDFFAEQKYPQSCPDYPVYPTVLEALRKELMQTDASGIAYTEVVDWVTKTTDADLNEWICRQGSLAGWAETVLPACERAVQLASETEVARAHDSRGLARTLLGDYTGALEDFKFALAWWQAHRLYERYGPSRERWIAALENGRNPFDAATQEVLRSENW